MYEIFCIRGGSARTHVTGIAVSYSNWTIEVLA